MSHVIGDWLSLHGLDSDLVKDAISAIKAGAVLADPLRDVEPSTAHSRVEMPGSAIETLTHIVVPAFCVALPTLAERIRENLSQIKLSDFDAAGPKVPHTIDNGESLPSGIVMHWSGSPADLLCLAHEAAHAVQLRLSQHAFMPPVAREACAFLGELFLLSFVQTRDDALFAALMEAWSQDNEAYLMADLDALAEAVQDEETPYHYRMNYPLARIAAAMIFARGDAALIEGLFSAGSSAMSHIPIIRIADCAGKVVNHLPSFPEASPAAPAIDAYRCLGALALLDLHFRYGEPERCLGDYYAQQLDHLRDRSVFLMLDEFRRPAAYASWSRPAPDNAPVLTRQSAPFGDHLALQETVARHLDCGSGVVSTHLRSARQEQTAW